MFLYLPQFLDLLYATAHVFLSLILALVTSPVPAAPTLTCNICDVQGNNNDECIKQGAAACNLNQVTQY